MDKLLNHDLAKLNQEASENLNKLTTPNENEVIIKKLTTNKSLGVDGFTGVFYQTFWEKLTPLLLKLFHKIKEGGRLSNLFCEASIILIANPDKDTAKKIIDQYLLSLIHI